MTRTPVAAVLALAMPFVAFSQRGPGGGFRGGPRAGP